MTPYPVHFEALPEARFTRLQLGLRVLLAIALGVIGVSTGGVYGLLYLGLPVVAAVRIGARGSSVDYAEQDGPRILLALRWVAAVTSWVGLASERLPKESPDETIRLEVDGTAHLSAGAAALRILLGLPSAFVLCLLSCIGALVWCWAAVSVLFSESMPRSAWAFLAGLQRYGYRLLAYQAGLVDEYPPFALSEVRGFPGPHVSS